MSFANINKTPLTTVKGVKDVRTILVVTEMCEKGLGIDIVVNGEISNLSFKTHLKKFDKNLQFIQLFPCTIPAEKAMVCVCVCVCV